MQKYKKAATLALWSSGLLSQSFTPDVDDKDRDDFGLLFRGNWKSLDSGDLTQE